MNNAALKAAKDCASRVPNVEEYADIIDEAITSVRKPLVEALKILLDSAWCLNGEEAEIPEEISAQFDINLDDARRVEAALAQCNEKQEPYPLPDGRTK